MLLDFIVEWQSTQVGTNNISIKLPYFIHGASNHIGTAAKKNKLIYSLHKANSIIERIVRLTNIKAQTRSLWKKFCKNPYFVNGPSKPSIELLGPQFFHW